MGWLGAWEAGRLGAKTTLGRGGRHDLKLQLHRRAKASLPGRQAQNPPSEESGPKKASDSK